MLIAAIDVPFQLFQHIKQLRMTRQEVREEMKESEGNPEIKGQIRQLQQEMAERRMMQEVPKADVVVTNPTHFAVALRYDDKRMRAPIVVAKGADAVAARIREVAAEHSVPIFEAPPLARALFRSVDLNGEVPARLYVAVAQVLTYVYQLRAAQRNRRGAADAAQPSTRGRRRRSTNPWLTLPPPPVHYAHAAEEQASACRSACSACSRWWCCRCRRSRSMRCSRSTSRCRS